MKWQDDERRRYGARALSQPAPGLFKMRLCKGGVYVPAAIEFGPTRDPLTGEPLDRSWHWRAIIDTDEVEAGPTPGPRVLDIWTIGRRIEEDEYRHLVAVVLWARKSNPHLPEANPRRPIDLNHLGPLFQAKD